MPGIGLAVGLGFEKGFSWSRYWANLQRNADEVEASGYPAINTGADNLSFTSPRYFFDKNNALRIRQNGVITKISFYLVKGATNIMYFQIWRKDGATYDLVVQEDISASLVNGVNTITLATTFNVIEGDFVAIGGTSTSGFTATGGYLAGSLRYTTAETPTTTDYDWDSKPSLAFVLPIKTYQQAPLMVGIGDSIMAGHTAHYSYVESSFTSSIANQILYQLNQLNSNFVYQNMGIGSQTTTDIVARFTADVVNLKPRVAIIQGGVNDIAGAVAKATFIANYTTMLDACAANSIIPVVCKIIPWSAGTNVQMQTRDDWMTDLQALVATYTDSVWCDFDSAIGEFRAGGDAGNLWDIKAEYNADNVHLNQDGYTAMAEVIYNKMCRR
jgi:lysophospholipase L1-like esterase